MRPWRERTDSEKSQAEKMPLQYCACGHPNTLHAGGFGDCAHIEGDPSVQCKCPLFVPKEAI